MLVRVPTYHWYSVNSSSHRTAARRRNRWKRGQAGLARGRLLRDAVQPSDQATPLARTQLVPALGQAGAIRHPPRIDHFRNAGRVLVHLLLCAYCAVPGLAYGWLRHDLYYGACLFARA